MSVPTMLAQLESSLSALLNQNLKTRIEQLNLSPKADLKTILRARAAMPDAKLRSDNERDELRALIEQQTKAFEAKNGAVKTLDIVKKTDDGSIWNDRKIQPKAKRNTAPSKPAPAPKPIEPTHHNAIRANQSAEKVGELLDEGKSVKEIAAALQRPERSIRYYRSRLMAINKSADAIEKTLNSIEARTK